jgi:hypothetical protein
MDAVESSSTIGTDSSYVAPAIVRLGSLSELTLGEGAGVPDGFGGAPPEASIVF